MSNQTETGAVRQTTSRKVVLKALAEAVLAIPGVVRLEPTISTTGFGLLLHQDHTDGIRLLTRAGAAEVDINIATRADCQARAVTHQVQADTARVLRAHGYQTGSTAVSVLTIVSATSI